MNSEQLQDFLSDLATSSFREKGKDDVDSARKLLIKTSHNNHLCMNYFLLNYTDIDLVQPITAQLLALYYKGGSLRYYTLQYIPCFIGCYLLALSKKQQKSISLLETFFLAIYNEEILADGPGSDCTTKKVEEVRIPSIRYPSIYHDPVKINALPEISTIRPGNTPSVLSTVRIGPYPTMKNFIAESKFSILTRMMKSVNGAVCGLSSDVLSRHICLATLSMALSGFSFPETSFRARVLDSELSQEVIEDYSRRSRQHVNSALLQEMLTGVYLALFNGSPDLALRAIDAVHLRAHYEMMPEVLLVTNALRSSLLENPLSKEKRDELMWTRSYQKEIRRKDLVTNASLRMRRMPEDIPIQETKEKEPSKLEELVGEGMDHLQDLKKRVSAISLHSKVLRRRKSDCQEMELQPIREERSATVAGDVYPPSPREKEEEVQFDERGEILPRKEETQTEHNGYSGKEECSSPSARRSPADLSDKGAYSVGGLRHMDSGSSTQRSID